MPETTAAPASSDLTGRALFPHRHLLSIADLKPWEIRFLLDEAEQWARANRGQARKHDDRLAGMTQINAFFENSTRTLLSFEIAGKRLGADVVNMHAGQSSVKKGETLIDTAMTLNAMAADVLVIRHASSGAVALIADKVDCPVLNAGDGWHQHPTQALLDALTIRRRKGGFEGLIVAICGDILHSRVARSNMLCLAALGALQTLAFVHITPLWPLPLLATVGSLVVSACAAYAIARLNLKHRQLILTTIVASSMFPLVTLLVPIFETMRSLGLLNSYFALVLPYVVLNLPVCTLVLVSFFQSIPRDLENAAMIDGCTRFGTLWRVVLPLSAPGVFTAGILAFVNAWDEFLLALSLNSTAAMRTLPVGITLYQGEFTFPWPIISAALIVAIVPVAIVIAIFQERVVGGLTAGGLKG